MLETLYIRNLALVPELEMEFGDGLNIVTGETGAGKSLIIGAVQLLTGARAPSSVIRKGEKTCEVTGVFTLEPRFAALKEEIAKRLAEADLPPCEEGRLLIRRVLTESGSRAYVNGTPVTAGFLKELCERLIDLHGPHDNQTLLLPSHQLELLDTFAELSPQILKLRQAFDELAQIRREREQMNRDGLTPEEADLLDFQLKEIDGAELAEDEEEPLLQKYRLASNSRKLVELAVSAQQALSGEDGSAADIIATQLRSLRELQELDPDNGGQLVASLEETADQLQDIATQFETYAEKLDIDQEELAQIEKRLDLLQRLKRKYGPTLADVLATAERIRTRLENIRSRSDRIQELAEREKNANQLYLACAKEISAARHRAAPSLANAIQEKLRHLGFLKAAFEIRLTPAAPGPSGTDAVEFAFAPNIGEDMQSLRQAASSGEIARVMLAVKTVLSDADSVPVLIFDEIDANVGGRVAVAVAEELKAVGRRHQVFSITHLPQIAAAGAQHFLVAKQVLDGRTNTTMKRLDQQGRLEEITRMLGADVTSQAAVAHAQELLQGGGTAS
ncbi:MAG: DNA repair protein RecN [Victivallales bacterium]|nr:DNA repair protein RecN [Victivallales bacterium]